MARLVVIVSAVLTLTGCSHVGNTVRWSDANTAPSGMRFSNGMPPSSNGPSPAWYAKRFGAVRGVGEAIVQNRDSLWDRDHGTFAYYIGGVLSAQYHPWEHYLQIRTDTNEENHISCRWTGDGALTVTADNKSTAGNAEATCKQLLNTLEKHIDPAGLLSNGS
jgi:hypothetical protein